jgi:hypothetical protein
MADKIKIKLLRRGLEGPRDAVVEVNERRARQLIQHRPALAVPFTGNAKADKALLNKMEAEPENKADPLEDSRRPGGQTGAAKQSSSSPAAQAPKTSSSTKSKAKPA